MSEQASNHDLQVDDLTHYIKSSTIIILQHIRLLPRRRPLSQLLPHERRPSLQKRLLILQRFITKSMGQYLPLPRMARIISRDDGVHPIQTLAVESRVLKRVWFPMFLEPVDVFPCLCTGDEGEFIGTNADDGAVLVVEFAEGEALVAGLHGAHAWEAAEGPYFWSGVFA